MTAEQRDTLIMQRCLARAVRRAARRQRARMDAMRAAAAVSWLRTRRAEPR